MSIPISPQKRSPRERLLGFGFGKSVFRERGTKRKVSGSSIRIELNSSERRRDKTLSIDVNRVLLVQFTGIFTSLSLHYLSGVGLADRILRRGRA